MRRLRAIPNISIVGFSILIASLYSNAAFAKVCDRWVAKAVSVQGSVQSLRAGEKQWSPVRFNDTICPGDMIRILSLGRADIVLSNEAILRLDQNTTVTFSEPDEEKTFLINLLNGAAYFFSRIRRSLKVSTPFVNAIVEGTEFFVRVESDRALVSLFDGRVALLNQAGTITLSKGQSAVAEANQAPILHTVVRPRDAVQWTLYYPPVLYYRPAEFQTSSAEWQTMVQKSIGYYMEGDLERALASIEGVAEEIKDPRFFTYRASLLLSVGRVDDARGNIEKALQFAPIDSDAIALQAIIAVTQNEKEKALGLAKKAVEADPRSSSARIALSYALQANFDLQGALASTKEAVVLEPENGLAWARLAELWLSSGELKEALQSANRAVSLNPNLARIQTVLGFAYLMQIETKRSKVAFQRAIELDQADPLPRLGLGLAKIREGDLTEGRAEIEIAASLDPDNALTRSYLGKAYYEEKRGKLASSQLAMAKELDPLDPTPFFYDAIQKQSLNRPVEALKDLQKSIELNDNRAVYRSRLLLDSDQAARSAGIARIYTDLNFQQLALVEGWKSTNTDPANYSAHRFLADSYSALPRHEIARVSELLQSQLLQPINITPVQPHLVESNLLMLNGAGPSGPSFNEFNPLFNRNRLALQASGIAGGNNTWGDEVAQSGVWGRLSYSVGQFHYQTDGFQENNDLRQDIYNIFVQGSLSYKTSLMAEIRSTETRKGDLDLRFLQDFKPKERQKEETQSIRLGFHQSFSPRSDLIGTFVYRDADFELNDMPVPTLGLSSKTDETNYGAELQHLFRSERFSLVGGIGHFNIDTNNSLITQSLFLPAPLSETQKSVIRHTNLYLYSQIKYLKDLTLTVGGSGDFFQGGIVDLNQFNPKLGLTWTPFSKTTLRAAVFRTLKRTLIADQTLEPTQVAGFNQFFDDGEGTESLRYGLAADQKFSKNIYGGAEYSIRNLKVPFKLTSFSPGSPVSETVVQQKDWEEHLGRAYLYWTPHPFLGFSAEYQYEEIDRQGEIVFGTKHVNTHRFPLGIIFYHPSGFSAGLKTTYIYQKGEFQPLGAAPSIFLEGSDQFWVFDASINYRLPKRLGNITIGAKNLFDRSFKFQDTDPANPIIQPRLLVFGKFTLTF